MTYQLKLKISKEAKDLLNLLLKKDPQERILPDQLLFHPFFSSFNYDDYLLKKKESPLIRYIKEIKFQKIFINQGDKNINDKGKIYLI